METNHLRARWHQRHHSPWHTSSNISQAAPTLQHQILVLYVTVLSGSDQNPRGFHSRRKRVLSSAFGMPSLGPIDRSHAQILKPGRRLELQTQVAIWSRIKSMRNCNEISAHYHDRLCILLQKNSTINSYRKSRAISSGALYRPATGTQLANPNRSVPWLLVLIS